MSIFLLSPSFCLLLWSLMVFLFFCYYLFYLASYKSNISYSISYNIWVHANLLPFFNNSYLIISIFYYSSNPVNTLLLTSLSTTLLPLMSLLLIIWKELPIIILSFSVFYSYSMTLTCYYMHDYCYYNCLFSYDILLYFDSFNLCKLIDSCLY